MTKVLAACLLVLSAGLMSAQEFKLGSRVADFELRDLDGKTVGFSQLKAPSPW
jgi:hypothetical protein